MSRANRRIAFEDSGKFQKRSESDSPAGECFPKCGFLNFLRIETPCSFQWCVKHCSSHQSPKRQFRYISVEGSCWTHMLLWMLSDLAWLQCWLYASLVIACIAAALSVFFIIRHLRARKFTGAFSEAAVILWLFANTFWMYGECHDIHYNTEILNPDAMLYDQAAKKTGHMLWTVGAMFLTLCAIRFVRGRFGFERFSTKAKMQSNSNIPLQTLAPVQSERVSDKDASESETAESPKVADDNTYSCLEVTGAAPLTKSQDAVDMVWPSQSPVWPHSDHK